MLSGDRGKAMGRFRFAGAAWACAVAIASGQAASAVQGDTVAPQGMSLAAGTEVSLEILDLVSSKTAAPDQWFAIRVAEPVLADGRVVVPAGATGQGQVVHAARAGGLGKAGELILAARRIDCGGTPIALRGLRYVQAGTSRSGAALAVSAVVPLSGVLVKGGEAVVPAGTRATAKLAGAVALPAACPVSGNQ